MRDIHDHLKSLDAMIEKLGGEDEGVKTEGPCSLLIEHLEAARRELIGAMPTEYALSLRQASESIACIPDHHLRADFSKTLHELTNSETPGGMLDIARSEQLPR